MVIMNEGAQVRNLFLVNEGGDRARSGIYLENATKRFAPLTGSGVRSEEKRHSTRNLYGRQAFCKERRLQRLQRKASNASGWAAR